MNNSIFQIFPTHKYGMGLPQPKFEEKQGGLWLTLRSRKVQPESRPESQPELLQVRILGLLREGPLSKSQISARLGHKRVSGQLNKVIRELLDKGAIAYTISKKPNSRLQSYRTTKAGREMLRER